ncbi:MAG: NAD(P)H-hydrate dehydratase, partial [Bacteroidetes bacterium]|nr:NAD(P)H-hydrate dehydratase [Bacteroidota bacterium]
MERAATNLTKRIMSRYDRTKRFVIFAGPGNNGGDGLVVARLLSDKGYSVEVNVVQFTDRYSEDFSVNMERLRKQGVASLNFITSASGLPVIDKEEIVVDALFGSGLSRPLNGLPAETVRHINNSGGIIIAVDVPSGLFGEDNSHNNREAIIKATTTFSFQFPKLSFFFPENYEYTGEWEVVPIGLHKEFIEKINAEYYFLTDNYINSLIPARKKFAHKGHFGHALLISGSYGKMGAAVLAAEACLRTGCGLLTGHVPKCGYTIFQTAVTEAMASVDPHERYITDLPDTGNYNAIGIGPGIGTDTETAEALHNLIRSSAGPMILDADAINILGMKKKWLAKLPPETILTPHPKEFERIAGKTGDHYSRNRLQLEMAMKYNIYIVLKGANTAVACPDGTCWFNTTGNPGMATAGSGDVLTGILLSLLSQGYKPKDAALTGVYLHGLAGDIAAKEFGQEAMIAGDITKNIGNAYKSLKNINK